MNAEHDLLASGVIDAELARLILGGRGKPRPELLMTSTGHLARIGISYGLAMADVGRRLEPILRNAFRATVAQVEAVEAWIRKYQGADS